MQAVLQFVGTSEDLEGLDTSRSNHRRNGVREEIWTATLTQQVDNLFLSCCETAHRTAKGFAQRACDDLHFAAEVIEFGHTVSCFADHSGRVRFIDHDESVVFLRELVDLIQRADIAVHREHTVRRYDAEALCLCFFQFLLQICHVSVGVAVTHRFAEAHAVDD